jgi:hypothetical protein
LGSLEFRFVEMNKVFTPDRRKRCIRYAVEWSRLDIAADISIDDKVDVFKHGVGDQRVMLHLTRT